MAQEVDVRAFAAAHADGALVVDVREPHEYLSGHVPNARLIPLSDLVPRAGELPRHQRVYVVCASGGRSALAADWLARAGYEAVTVAGGTEAWRQAGYPVVSGLREGVA